MTSAEDQVRVEAELARQLLSASSSRRQALYGEVYDRIYEMHLDRSPDILDFGASADMIPVLLSMTAANQQVLEFGCGMGFLAIELAKQGRSTLGVDVSSVALAKARERGADTAGVRFEQVAGLDLPLPAESIDFAFSVEVLEHLHEQDVRLHLQEIFRVLRPGGRYWIQTPHSGTHLSAAKRFGVEVEDAGDVHLKEWTYGELARELRAAGFRNLRTPWRYRYVHRRYGWLPLWPDAVPRLLERLPVRLLTSPERRAQLGLNNCSMVAVRPFT